MNNLKFNRVEKNIIDVLIANLDGRTHLIDSSSGMNNYCIRVVDDSIHDLIFMNNGQEDMKAYREYRYMYIIESDQFYNVIYTHDFLAEHDTFFKKNQYELLESAAHDPALINFNLYQDQILSIYDDEKKSYETISTAILNDIKDTQIFEDILIHILKQYYKEDDAVDYNDLNRRDKNASSVKKYSNYDSTIRHFSWGFYNTFYDYVSNDDPSTRLYNLHNLKIYMSQTHYYKYKLIKRNNLYTMIESI